jgi:hypothetical protein
MAAENLSGISGALAQTMAPQLTRNWNRRAVFLQNVNITSGAGQGGGQNVAWDVEFSTGGATAATFTEGADVTTYSEDPVTKALLNWGMYQSTFQLSNLEINAAAANIANATALEDIVGERFLGAIASITDKMETDCFTGSGAGVITGLNTAIAASGSYAGVAVASFPEWAGNVQANGGTPQALTLAQLATAEGLAFTASGMEPDYLETTPLVYSKYESLFNATVRTVTDGSKPIPQFQGSSGRLYWRGKPIIRNRRCPAGKIYMINSDEVELVVLPWANVPDGVMVVSREAMSSNGNTADTIKIPFKVYPLARTGSAVKFAVEVYAQLKVKRPNAHVVISDVQET